MANASDSAFQYDGVDGNYPAWFKKADAQLYSTHADIPTPDGPARLEVGAWAHQDKDGNVKVTAHEPASHKAPTPAKKADKKADKDEGKVTTPNPNPDGGTIPILPGEEGYSAPLGEPAPDPASPDVVIAEGEVAPQPQPPEGT